MTNVIALLTDFGTRDIYTGVMKGVMQGIAPQTPVIDITHDIQPQNIRQAAFALLRAYHYFAPGTVFVVVVDPGVGSDRKPIAVEAGGYRFVAPDNGVLTYALGQSDDMHVVGLTNRSYHLPELSNTFHGRDIFAPAAAHLISGVALDELGARQDKLFRLPMPQLTVSAASLGGEVMHIDHFGNVITSIGPFRWVASDQLLLVPAFGKKDCALTISAPDTVIEIKNVTLPSVHRAYHETTQGELLALIGSSGYLEVAVNQGNAAARLDVTAGDQVSALIIG